MKRIAFLIIAVLLSLVAQAQIEQPRRILEIGVSGGLNLSQIDFQPTIRQEYNKGINGGIFARYTSEKYFGMICAAQVELNFSQRGWIENFDDGTKNGYSRSLNYIELPLLAHLSWGKEDKGLQFFINLGPQFAFFMGEKEEYEGNWQIESRPESIRAIYGKDIENKFDYGITGGLGFELKTKAGSFFIEGRYYYGLSDIYKNSKLDEFGRSANNIITVKLGYAIRIL